MKAASSVRELRDTLEQGGSCKTKLPEDEHLLKAVEEAGIEQAVSEKGVLLIPRGVTRVLLACVASLGTVVARATFEGYRLGLKRSPEGWFLYFEKESAEPSREESHEGD